MAGPWGQLSLGRQYTMLYWALLDADVLGPNVYGTASLDSYIPNARADNAIAYRGTFSGFTVGATYSLGRDAVNAGPSPAGTNCAGESATNQQDCREWSALLKFDTAAGGGALAIDEFRGGPGAFGGLTSGTLTDTRISLNGYVKLGTTKLGAGVIRRDNEGSTTPKSDLWYLGVTQPVTDLVTVDAELMRLDVKDTPNRATLFAVRGTYQASKRTAVYATVGRLKNDGTLALSVSGGAAGSNPIAGGSQSAVMAGVRHMF